MTTAESEQSTDDVKIVPTGGCYDCGGRCVIKVHVKDGVAVRVESDDGEAPQLRACLKGRAFRKQVYSPDRLLHPLKRVGPRGKGEFERISWDEALDTVANQIQRISDTYGSQSIAYLRLSGPHVGERQGGIPLPQVFNSLGGCTTFWGAPSYEGSAFASRANYGTLTTGNTRDDLLNSRLILAWGMNPAESIFANNTILYLTRAREAGTKVVVVDPRYTDTAAVIADQWIPIRPGTDAAMVIAMAHVMITEELHDQAFLDRCTVGFDKFKDYVIGKEDGVAKTPAWAEDKTGIAADTIANLAREYAGTKPAALFAGFAPGRTAYGEQFVRAASTLAAMTGNIGIHGGDAVGFGRADVGMQVPFIVPSDRLGTPYEVKLKGLDVPRRLRTRVHTTKVWDAILKGKQGGYPSDIKMAYVAGANPVNQLLNTNKGVKAMEKLDFIVVHDFFMTATARFADVVLPVANHWEKGTGLSRPWLSGPWFVYLNKVVPPPPDVKTDAEIGRELAKRLGVYDPAMDVTEEEGIARQMRMQEDAMKVIPDLEKFKRDGVHKIKLPEPLVSFKEEITDLENNPIPTPSGKIEIYCQRIADLNNPDIPPIPKYIETWEGPGDPLIEKYPLQLLTFHHKTRAHSNFYNNPWLKDLEPQRIWINTRDAQQRGINRGDEVRVFNDRGETIIQANVTERIMPGVVALGQGAWYKPDEKGRDRGGNPNVLTRDTYSPGGAFPSNTILVQVESFKE